MYNIPVEFQQDPSLMPLPDGGAEISIEGPLLNKDDPLPIPENLPHNANLAAYVNKDALKDIAQECISGYEQDLQTTDEYRSMLKDGIRLLGMSKDGTSVFEGVNAISHPILLKIVTRAQNRALSEMFPSGGPVRTKINGNSTGDRTLETKASNVRAHMNWQLTDQMPEYEEELDRMLFYLFLNGSAFKKVYFDSTIGRMRSQFLTVDDFICNNNVSSLDDCDRYSHIFKLSSNMLKKFQLTGKFLDIDVSPNTSYIDTKDTFKKEFNSEVLSIEVQQGESDEHTIIEQHYELDLPGFEHYGADGQPDGLKLPYIVFLHQHTRKILGIYRNWRPNDGAYRRRDNFVHYYFMPGVGLLGLGYLHMIGGLVEGINASMRHLIAAGAFSNFPGGYVDKRLKLTGGQQLHKLGEYKRVETYGQKIGDMFYAIPGKEPSPTLYQLHTYMVDLVNEYSGTAEEIVQNAATYGPVGTILALLERAESPQASVHKRLHRSQARELKLISELNFETLPESEQVPYGAYGAKISREDYNGISVVPVSNPNIPTASHRLAMVRAQLEMGTSAPQFYDLRELHVQANTIINPDSVERIMPPPQQLQPMDPITEFQTVIQGKPAKAFPEQPHDLHVSILATLLEDPRYGGALQEPQKQAVQALIIDHLGWRCRQEVEQVLGTPLPPPGQPLPPQVAYAINSAIAVAVKALQSASMSEVAPNQDEIDNMIENRKLDLKEKEIEKKDQQFNKELNFKEKELAITTGVDIEGLELEEKKLNKMTPKPSK